VIGETTVTLHAFYLVLSHWRMEAIVWAERQDELYRLTSNPNRPLRCINP
jgi:hypothetical protein